MEIIITGNTAKEKKFFPATADKPAMLYFDLAEKVGKRGSESEKTVWYKVKAARKYAEYIYDQLHGEEQISRKVMINGVVVDEPKVHISKDGKARAYNTIWVNKVTWLDQKWPAALPQEEEDEVPAEIAEATEVADEATPWD